MFYGKHKLELSGGEKSTTNNRMELTAAVEALSRLTEPCEVELYSDSRYLVDGLEKGWAASWKRKGWRRANGDPALNPDLWDKLLELTATHKVTLRWVKGHASNEWNNRCDELAVAETKKHI